MKTPIVSSTMPIDESDPIKTGGDCVLRKLQRASRAMARQFDNELRAVGINNQQYALLDDLARGHAMSATALSRSLGLRMSTISRNVRPLCTQGLIEVVAGSDARSKRIMLTAAGRERWAQARCLWGRVQQQIGCRLGADNVCAIHAAIDVTLARMGTDDDIA